LAAGLRRKLMRFLAPLRNFKFVAQADTVRPGHRDHRAQTDVIYLDIQLGAHSGFDVLEAIRGTESPHIVSQPSYSEYAVKPSTCQALDYLLKPYDAKRFCCAASNASSGGWRIRITVIWKNACARA